LLALLRRFFSLHLPLHASLHFRDGVRARIPLLGER